LTKILLSLQLIVLFLLEKVGIQDAKEVVYCVCFIGFVIFAYQL